jgi:pentatricopeptide repeat protein
MKKREFDQLFGISNLINEEKTRFVKRIETSIFNVFAQNMQWDEGVKLFQEMCEQMGENPVLYEFSVTQIPNLKLISKKDFNATANLLEKVYQAVSDNQNKQIFISRFVNDALNRTNLNIGVEWNNGFFYPTNDRFLDEKLLESCPIILENFPKQEKLFFEAVEHFKANEFSQSVQKSVLVYEAICKAILDNNLSLDENKEGLLRILQFSNYWHKIFINYLKYANEYKKYSETYPNDLKPDVVERFLYLTCLIIRATLKSIVKS